MELEAIDSADSADNDDSNERNTPDDSGGKRKDGAHQPMDPRMIHCTHCGKQYPNKKGYIAHLQEELMLFKEHNTTDTKKTKKYTKTHEVKKLKKIIAKCKRKYNVNTHMKNMDDEVTAGPSYVSKKMKRSDEIAQNLSSIKAINSQKRPIGRLRKIQNSVNTNVPKKSTVCCTICKEAFARYDIYEQHCNDKHGHCQQYIVKLVNQKKVTNDNESQKQNNDHNPEVTQADDNGAGTGNNMTKDNIIQIDNKEINRKRKNDDYKYQSKRPRIEDTNSSDLVIITDYLQKNPKKIKPLLEVLNLNSDHRMILYKCNECGIHVNKKNEFRKHLQAHKTNERVVKCKCTGCDLDFTIESLQRHVEIHETDDGVTAADFRIIDDIEQTPVIINTSEKTSALDNKCSESREQEPYNNIEVPNINSASETMKKRHHSDRNVSPIKGQLFRCEHCHLQFNARSSLDYHIQQRHIETTKDFRIWPGGQRTGPKPGREAEKTLPIDLHLCTICGLHFNQRCNAGAHYARETKFFPEYHIERSNKISEVCDICKIKFSRQTLAKHVCNHHRLNKAGAAEDFNIIPFVPTDFGRTATEIRGDIDRTREPNELRIPSELEKLVANNPKYFGNNTVTKSVEPADSTESPARSAEYSIDLSDYWEQSAINSAYIGEKITQSKDIPANFRACQTKYNDIFTSYNGNTKAAIEEDSRTGRVGERSQSLDLINTRVDPTTGTPYRGKMNENVMQSKESSREHEILQAARYWYERRDKNAQIEHPVTSNPRKCEEVSKLLASNQDTKSGERVVSSRNILANMLQSKRGYSTNTINSNEGIPLIGKPTEYPSSQQSSLNFAASLLQSMVVQKTLNTAGPTNNSNYYRNAYFSCVPGSAKTNQNNSPTLQVTRNLPSNLVPNRSIEILGNIDDRLMNSNWMQPFHFQN